MLLRLVHRVLRRLRVSRSTTLLLLLLLLRAVKRCVFRRFHILLCSSFFLCASAMIHPIPRATFVSTFRYGRMLSFDQHDRGAS